MSRRTAAATVSNVDGNRGHAHAVIHAAANVCLLTDVLNGDVNKAIVGEFESIVDDLCQSAKTSVQRPSNGSPSQWPIVSSHEPSSPSARQDFKNGLDFGGRSV